jgi:hypothetical protein
MTETIFLLHSVNNIRIIHRLLTKEKQYLTSTIYVHFLRELNSLSSDMCLGLRQLQVGLSESSSQ